MMLKINNLLLFIMIGCFFTPNIVNGQSWNLPDDRVNNRFFSNGEFSIIRPGLTFQGFKSGDNFGLDVKTLLSMVFPDRQRGVFCMGLT